MWQVFFGAIHCLSGHRFQSILACKPLQIFHNPWAGLRHCAFDHTRPIPRRSRRSRVAILASAQAKPLRDGIPEV